MRSIGVGGKTQFLHPAGTLSRAAEIVAATGRHWVYRPGLIVRCRQIVNVVQRGTPINEQERAVLSREVIADFEAILVRLADAHAPEFLDVDITMPQAKVLYLLSVGDCTMSELVVRLGVTLPTVSGVVDRLVERGLIRRRAHPSDRRRVVVGITPAGVELLDRFRDLNARQLRDLLAVLDDADLEQIRGYLALLDRGMSRLAAAGQRPIPAVLSPHRGDPT